MVFEEEQLDLGGAAAEIQLLVAAEELFRKPGHETAIC